MRKLNRQLWFSFPVQLLLLHLRSNLLLLTLWVLLFLLMSGSIGRRLGLQYLFLDPEYLGKVNFLSFYLIGLALGGFFMSWNLTTYLLTAHRFPFLASLSRPFTKFSINNALLPLIFGLMYVGLLAHFQYRFQEFPLGKVFINLLALLLGSFSLVIGYILYFRLTNRDISYYRRRRNVPPNLDFQIAPGYRKVDLDYIKLDTNRIQVNTYLNEYFRPRLVRSVAHYESRLLLNIFKQNHLNALALQLVTMIMLLMLGYLIDYPLFRIPAGASILILFSVFSALIGALTYWFAEWRALAIIILLVVINYVTAIGWFNHPNQAYGLDYDGPRPTYSYDSLLAVCYSNQVQEDKRATERILQRWERRVAPGRKKPKLVLICASGGGLKAAVWSTHVLQAADSLTNGALFDHTVLMTGASGGMLGMAYLRELYRRRQAGDSINYHSPYYRNRIGMDLLNSIAFTIVSTDVFLPWTRFDYGGQTYFKDRGYIFEEQFNENTEGVLDRPLSDYREDEAAGRIPLLFLTPSIVNDGRQLVISPQGVSYMMIAPVALDLSVSFEPDAVDFGHLFRHRQVDSLRFLSALRMSATYPYVLPNVHLPSSPVMEVVDAGFRDNYGILAATRFLQVFKDWIQANTSEVILVQISSSEKIENIESNPPQGAISSMFNPLGIAGKVFAVQEFEHDASLSFIYDLLGENGFHLVRFIYQPSDRNKLEASVSFHLTEQEEQDVLHALELPENQSGLRRLRQLLAD